jgi:hypothetical protein
MNFVMDITDDCTPRFSRLIRTCGWETPHRIIGVSAPTPPGQTGETTGICPQCQHQYVSKKEAP